MSHIVCIQSKVRDPAAVEAACRRLDLPAPVVGTAVLYGGHVNGLLIRLPGWLYPAVVDIPTGELKYDNFEGTWGEKVHLDRFLQCYAVERAKLEARKQGLTVTEQTLGDGSIRVQIVEATG